MFAVEKPRRKKVEVPAELLSPGAPPAMLYGGRFMIHIKKNWLGGEANTRLTGEQMEQVAALPWFGGWRCGLERRSARAETYQTSMEKKADWLYSMFAVEKP